MNNARPWSPSRLLPSLIGLFLLIAGAAMIIGGARLVALGGSWYYLIAGVAFAIDGLLLIAARRAALWWYALVLLASTIWSLAEVGLSWWELVPRLAMWCVIGLVMLLPWVRRPLTGRSGNRGGGRLATPALIVAVLIVGGVAIASQFTHPGTREGRIASEQPHEVNPAYAAGDDWPSYGGTQAGTHYSSLDQITPDNVGQLEEAWRIETGDLPGPHHPAEITDENTPLKVNGMLYVCTPHSKVLALDPDTGETKWRHDTKLSQQGAENFSNWAHMTCRGLAYHDDNAYSSSGNQSADTGRASSSSASAPATASNGNGSSNGGNAQACPRRIFLPTADARLIALNADNGKRCESFGDQGTVDLTRGIGSFAPGGYYSTSPPVVTKNLVIIGGHVTDNASTDEPSGVVRAYDVHDGHLVWNWDSGNPTETEPLAPGEHYTRNSPNVWAPMSVDEAMGLVYLPVGNQMPDQYGGNRPPATEQYSSSLVALHLDSGQVAWHQQLTHHDLWDYDPPAQPILTDKATDSGMRQVVIQPTKQGNLYVFDRRTGEPVVPIDEVSAPQGTVEDDHAAPTQPRSRLNLLPPKLTEADMWGATPFDQLMCRIQFKSLRYDGQYTPPSLQGSISYPGNVGVMNWGGVAVDPARQTMFTVPKYLAFVLQLIPREQVGQLEQGASEHSGLQPNTGAPYAVGIGPLLSPIGLPCQAPSWGDVAGIDMQKSEVVWQHPNGTARDSTPLVPVPLPVGVPALGGPITTAGGVAFESGTLDYYVRGYDTTTGEQLWKARLPAGGNATPMTYTGSDGDQYLLVTAGGHGTFGTEMGDSIIAYKLPTNAD